MALFVLLVSFVVLMVLGAPVAVTMFGSSLMYILVDPALSFSNVATKVVNGVTGTSLLSLPLFILAGEIMNSGGVTQRLFRFPLSFIGHLKGGLAYVNVAASMLFAGMSGSAIADTAGLGKIEMDAMDDAGYEKEFSVAITASSSTIGPIIPPSTNMIVFASLTGFSIGKLFIGGLIPGIIIGVCLMIMCNWYARKYNVDAGSGAFDLHEVWTAFKNAFFALITPLIIVGGVTSGYFTATESGIVACLYGLICGFFIYRTLHVRDLVNIFKRAASSSAMLMMIMGISNIYSYIFARENLAANGLTGEILQCDLRTAPLPAGGFDLVISNPPYFPVGSGKSGGPARSEKFCTLEQLCAAAGRLVKNGGRFALCHRPERLTDMLCALRAHDLEPKRLKLVSHGPGHPPSLLLAEAVKQGRPGVSIETAVNM